MSFLIRRDSSEPSPWILRGRCDFDVAGVRGDVAFHSSAYVDEGFLVSVRLSCDDLSRKSVGIHVHGYDKGIDQEYDPGIPHYDPYRTGFHSLPGGDEAHHLGDLGNIHFDDQGVCSQEMFIRAPLFGTPQLPLATIAGKILMIHESEDDGGDMKNGHSGAHRAHSKIVGYDLIHVIGACPQKMRRLSESDAYVGGCNEFVVRDGEELPLSIEQVAVYEAYHMAPHLHIKRYIGRLSKPHVHRNIFF
jgi:Cu/Zn superoxide dismutase